MGVSVIASERVVDELAELLLLFAHAAHQLGEVLV
jgi:hypothetical protein